MIVEFKNKYRTQVWPHLDKENKEMFQASFFKKFLFVKDEKALGWVILQPSKDRILLDFIFVLENYREKKIGTELLDFVKKYAHDQGMRGISVNTGSKTVWARKFYEKNGFKKVGSVKKFFKFDPEHMFYWFSLQNKMSK